MMAMCVEKSEACFGQSREGLHSISDSEQISTGLIGLE
jgi:hypothetical protein